jgi:hypothetical protein
MRDIQCLCGNFILKSYSDSHKTKLRAAVLVFDEVGVAKAICRKCKMEHAVPIVLDEVLAKGIRQDLHKRKKLFVRKSVEPEVVSRKKVVDRS